MMHGPEKASERLYFCVTPTQLSRINSVVENLGGYQGARAVLLRRIVMTGLEVYEERIKTFPSRQVLVGKDQLVLAQKREVNNLIGKAGEECLG